MQLSEYTARHPLKDRGRSPQGDLAGADGYECHQEGLDGGDAKNSELSEVSMEMIRSLAEERPKTSGVITSRT